jgi:hypothetical protein
VVIGLFQSCVKGAEHRHHFVNALSNFQVDTSYRLWQVTGNRLLGANCRLLIDDCRFEERGRKSSGWPAGHWPTGIWLLGAGF